MPFEGILAPHLDEERARIAAIYGGEALPEAPLVMSQQVPLERFRLPEYFRGCAEADVAFVGPHALLVPEEEPPLYGASMDEYCAYYRANVPRRIPFSHYSAICGDRPWLSLELPPYQAEKDLVIACMKGAVGGELSRRSLDLIWALLRESGARTLVVTGADAQRWVWPALGLPGKPPSATQGHGKVWGDLSLPGASGRSLQVVTSFHWGKEVPLFVRKVPGLGELTPREAISEARAMITRSLL